MKKIQRILMLSMLLALLLTIGSSAEGLLLDPNAFRAQAYCSSPQPGKVKVTINVNATGIMSELGASSVTIYKQDGTAVATFEKNTTQGMTAKNSSRYSGSVTYNGTTGQKYYAVVICYASRSSGTSKQTVRTASVTA